jgi:hypothetical protein
MGMRGDWGAWRLVDYDQLEVDRDRGLDGRLGLSGRACGDL